MSWLLCVLIAIILYVQLSYPTRFRQDFKIIQTDISRLKPSMLLEKFPIVIDDRIVDPLSLLTTTFKYQYIWKTEPVKLIGCPRAKYTLLYNNTAETQHVDLSHPKHKHVINPPITQVLLHSHQILILPPQWVYKMSTSMQCIELWDISHWIRANLF
jgi:hypothetical protein